MAIPFRALPIGAHFKFPGSPHFSSTAKKVSSRCYVWSGKKAVLKPRRRGEVSLHNNFIMRVGLIKSCVGTVNVAVEPSGRKSVVKKRGGRGRGGKTFGGR